MGDLEKCLKKCFPTGIGNVRLAEKKITLLYISTVRARFLFVLNLKDGMFNKSQAHAFNSSTKKAEAGDCCEFQASLVYVLSSRAVRST